MVCISIAPLNKGIQYAYCNYDKHMGGGGDQEPFREVGGRAAGGKALTVLPPEPQLSSDIYRCGVASVKTATLQ